MKNEKKHEMGEGKQMRKMERKMEGKKGYKAGSKKTMPCKYKMKGMNDAS